MVESGAVILAAIIFIVAIGYLVYSSDQPIQSLILEDHNLSVNLVAPNGSTMYYTMYKNATDPTYDELMTFLATDHTQDTIYVYGQYECTNYAVDLYNNAECQGIKAHIVSIDFADGSPGHAIDAFNTTDRGMMYIDSTGETLSQLRQGEPNVKMIAYPQVGQSYEPQYLNGAIGGWSVTPSMSYISRVDFCN